MKTKLGEILKLSKDDISKVESRLKKGIFTTTKEIGSDYIKKASELD